MKKKGINNPNNFAKLSRPYFILRTGLRGTIMDIYGLAPQRSPVRSPSEGETPSKISGASTVPIHKVDEIREVGQSRGHVYTAGGR